MLLAQAFGTGHFPLALFAAAQAEIDIAEVEAELGRVGVEFGGLE